MKNKLKKIAYLAIRTVVYFIDKTWSHRKVGWLLHGYNGQPIGNNFALLKYCHSRTDLNLSLAWAGKKALPQDLNNITFCEVPDRYAPIGRHISFLLSLLKFKVISVESAGDLRLYLQFLPRKKRLIVLLPHGFCLKSAGVLALNLTDEQRRIWGDVGKNFDLISASSQIESYILSATLRCPIENISVIGQQRQTPSGHYTESERIAAIKVFVSTYNRGWDVDRLIVYAPTHRDHCKNHQTPVPFAFSSYFALNEVLAQNKSWLLIRSHALQDSIGACGFSNIILSSSGPNLDFNLIAPATDLLITDYSGIFIDFLPAQMELAFWQYDLDLYRKVRGFSISEEIFDIGAKIDSPDDFERLLCRENRKKGNSYKRAVWAELMKQNDSATSLKLTTQTILKRTNS